MMRDRHVESFVWWSRLIIPVLERLQEGNW